MIIRNKLDITFGPVGSSTGLFLFLGGIVATYFSLLGVPLVLIGAFVWLTTTSTFIDPPNKRVKFSNDLFGIVHLGKWIDINPAMKLGLKKAHRGYRAYSRGTQPADFHFTDIKIILYGQDNREIFPLKRIVTSMTARLELSELSNTLGLEIIS